MLGRNVLLNLILVWNFYNLKENNNSWNLKIPGIFKWFDNWIFKEML